MSVSYDEFTNAFIAKVTEYDFLGLDEDVRTTIVDGYMKKALTSFRKNCKHDFFTTGDDETRTFNVEVPEDQLDEITNIVSEGMVMHWMKPYLYKQELLENALNTRDFTTYSPAHLLEKVGDAYRATEQRFVQMIREYSYNNSTLSNLHL